MKKLYAYEVRLPNGKLAQGVIFVESVADLMNAMDRKYGERKSFTYLQVPDTGVTFPLFPGSQGG